MVKHVNGTLEKPPTTFKMLNRERVNCKSMWIFDRRRLCHLHVISKQHICAGDRHSRPGILRSLPWLSCHNSTVKMTLLTFLWKNTKQIGWCALCEMYGPVYLYSTKALNTQGWTSCNASVRQTIKLLFIAAIYNMPLSVIIEVLSRPPPQTEEFYIAPINHHLLTALPITKTVSLCRYKTCAALTFMSCELIYLNSLWEL